jgi:predicted metal-dependent peptidase
MNATDSTTPERNVAIGQQLRLSRALAANLLPFFADALFTARLVLAEGLPGMAAVDNHMRVYFNPQIVHDCMDGLHSEAVTRQLAWVWVHEISHILREHHWRGMSIKAASNTWNIACDIEINDNEFETLIPPQNYSIVTHDTFDFEPHHIAEHYYSELKKSHVERELPLMNEGSGVHGRRCDWELPFDDPSVPGVNPITQRLIIDNVAREIRSVSRKGNFPADWLRWAEQRQPKVDWRRLLSRRIKRAMTLNSTFKSHFTFQRPSRRSTAYAPFVRPSLTGIQTQHVAVVIDTSGSIDSEMISQFMGELRGILEQCRAMITAIPCDTIAYEPIPLLTAQNIKKVISQLRGGGGTDMTVGIEAAMMLVPKPEMIIVLTDGYTPYPESCPARMDVIFAIFESEIVFTDSSMPDWVQRSMIKVPLAERSTGQAGGLRLHQMVVSQTVTMNHASQQFCSLGYKDARVLFGLD